MAKKSTQDRREAAELVRHSKRHFTIGENKQGIFVTTNMTQSDFVGIMGEMVLQDDVLKEYLENTLSTVVTFQQMSKDDLTPKTLA